MTAGSPRSRRYPPARHDLLAGGYAFGAIQTTRGCPMNCTFCSVPAFNGTRYRQRPIPDVVNEFQLIREKRVLVVDDNLIGTRPEHIARAKDLFRVMAQANLQKEWVAQATVNFGDDEELLTLAAKAGAQASSSALSPPHQKDFWNLARDSTWRRAGISASPWGESSGTTFWS